MSEGTLLIYLLLALAGSIICFVLTRHLCKTYLAKNQPKSQDEGAKLSTSASLESDPSNLAKIQAIYTQVFWLRMLALGLCLLAFIAWWFKINFIICLILAALGCVALYSAYHLRTHKALQLLKKSQDDTLVANSKKSD